MGRNTFTTLNCSAEGECGSGERRVMSGSGLPGKSSSGHNHFENNVLVCVPWENIGVGEEVESCGYQGRERGPSRAIQHQTLDQGILYVSRSERSPA